MSFLIFILFAGRLTETKKKKHSKLTFQKNENLHGDTESLASTDISLLTVGSVKFASKEEYGVLGHYSPYEHLVNKLCRKQFINDYAELINKKLKQYKKSE